MHTLTTGVCAYASEVTMGEAYAREVTTTGGGEKFDESVCDQSAIALK